MLQLKSTTIFPPFLVNVQSRNANLADLEKDHADSVHMATQPENWSRVFCLQNLHNLAKCLLERAWRPNIHHIRKGRGHVR